MIDGGFWKGKKVLLTGHTGFKGSWLSIWLSSLGAEVYGYALEPPTKPSLFEKTGLKDIVHHATADVRDRGAITKYCRDSGPDIVFHMAAQPLVRESYNDPAGTYETNVMGTVNLLEAVRVTGSVRAVVIITTDKVYENREWYWGYRENESLGGYDPYSSSKACSELATMSYRNSFFNPADYGKKHRVALASARAGNVIGGGDWAADRLIPDAIRAFQRGEKVRIRNPHATRPWQHVLEPLAGYLMLAEKLSGDDGADYAEAWNFGPYNSDARTVEWILGAVCDSWGKGAAFEIDGGEHPHEARFLRLDISKAEDRLGWKPRWDVLQAVRRTVGMYRQIDDNPSNVYGLVMNDINTYNGK